MTQKHDIETFDDLSISIIKYCSETFARPLFFIWYTDTDENSTDRLLTFKNGNIFAVSSLKDLKEVILSELDNLVAFEELNVWLDNSKYLEFIQDCTYDIPSIINSIGKGNLDITNIENLADFIDLYEDFAYQDERNNYLQVYSDNELIKQVWYYFYEYIFWARFNDREKFESWDRPQLVIDTKELLLKLQDVIKTFEDNIKVIR